MKMFVLKKFLFAMKLETGGLIIGSVHLLIQAAIFLYCAAHLTIYDCSDFEKSLQLPENRICMFKRDFIAFAWIFLITAGGLAFLCYHNCIKGIREKNFELLGPFVTYLAVFAICSIYDIFFFTVQGAIMALIKGAITGYMFLVVNSYYIGLRDGPESKLVPTEEC